MRPMLSWRSRSLTQAPLLVLVTVLVPALATAQSEEKREVPEPLLIEETMPTAPREFEMRLGVELGDDESLLPHVQGFYGLMDRLSAEVDLPFLRLTPGEGPTEYGLGTVGLGVKWLLVEPRDQRPAWVLGLEVGIPRGDDEEREIEPFLASRYELGAIYLQGNVGASFAGDETRLVYGLAMIVAFGDKPLYFLGEVNQTDDERVIGPGVKVRLHDEWYLGLAVPFQLKGDQDHRLLVQLQAGFGGADQ